MVENLSSDLPSWVKVVIAILGSSGVVAGVVKLFSVWHAQKMKRDGFNFEAGRTGFHDTVAVLKEQMSGLKRDRDRSESLRLSDLEAFRNETKLLRGELDTHRNSKDAEIRDLRDQLATCRTEHEVSKNERQHLAETLAFLKLEIAELRGE